LLLCGVCDCVRCTYSALSFFFFFSSRRRHTRSKRDWSSDVCSSDLAGISRRWHDQFARYEKRPRVRAPIGRMAQMVIASVPETRSEERRVGKECRSRWSTDRGKEKEEKTGRGVGCGETDSETAKEAR